VEPSRAAAVAEPQPRAEEAVRESGGDGHGCTASRFADGTD